MSSAGIVLSEADFRQKLDRASGLLFFHKLTCPNCKALEKVIEKFLAANPDVTLMRIDSVESPEAMKALGAERVPTLYIMKDGKVVARKVGLMNLREMTDFYRSAWVAR